VGFQYFSPEPQMPKTSAPEWLLARLTDPTRAAAIMGDLLEISAIRGPLWFWTAYARTLVTLGWRGPVALLFAIACMKLMFREVLPWLAHVMTDRLSDAGLFGQQNLRVSMILWNIPMVMAECLIFALPFALVRFGLRSRLTQLACILFVIAIPVYAPLPWVRDLSGVLTVLAIMTALVASLWRRPMMVLAGTCATAVVAVVVCVHTLVAVFHQNFFRLPGSTKSICNVVGVALAVIVCSGLHARLLGKRSIVA
jgi:hypothetical protein